MRAHTPSMRHTTVLSLAAVPCLHRPTANPNTRARTNIKVCQHTPQKPAQFISTTIKPFRSFTYQELSLTHYRHASALQFLLILEFVLFLLLIIVVVKQQLVQFQVCMRQDERCMRSCVRVCQG